QTTRSSTPFRGLLRRPVGPPLGEFVEIPFLGLFLDRARRHTLFRLTGMDLAEIVIADAIENPPLIGLFQPDQDSPVLRTLPLRPCIERQHTAPVREFPHIFQ